MAKIDRMLVGESLVGDGNEVAHIDLIIGPRGSPVESAFANALTNNKALFLPEPRLGQQLMSGARERFVRERLLDDRARTGAVGEIGRPHATETGRKNNGQFRAHVVQRVGQFNAVHAGHG